MASGYLYLNYPSDSATRAPDGPPTFVQLEALRHLASSPGVLLRISASSFEVIHWAKELAKKRVACDSEESVTAVTSTMERALPATPQKVWQLLCMRVVWPVAKFVGLFSIPKASSSSRRDVRRESPEPKSGLPKELYLVAHPSKTGSG